MRKYQEGPTWSDLIPFLKTWVSSPKIVAYSKSREISGPYNFWTPLKSSVPDAWNRISWTLFRLEIEVGGAIVLLAPHLPPPMATPLHI